MEGPAYLGESQRAMIAARRATVPAGVAKSHLQQASIEAPVSQAVAAKRLSVGRSSVQGGIDLLKNAAPELVKAVDDGLIAVSAASRLLALRKSEQVKIATADRPRLAARLAVRRLGKKGHSDIDPTRLFEQLTSIFDKTPTAEMRELVRLLPRPTSDLG